MSKYNVIIQDTWNEEEDKELLKYMDDNNIYYKTISKDDINSICVYEYDCIFMDTNLITQICKNNKIDIINYYSTYPIEFKELYKRDIVKCNLTSQRERPYFIKPCEDNNKLFGGFVVNSEYDVQYIKEKLDKQENQMVYICDCVEFMNEYRIFYEKGKVWGIVESTDFILDGEVMHDKPPQEFINKCTDIMDKMDGIFFVLDIGMIKDGNWVVVELNPPYSLTSYGFPIKDYFEYCIQFWKNINYFQKCKLVVLEQMFGECVVDKHHNLKKCTALDDFHGGEEIDIGDMIIMDCDGY